MTQKTFGGPAIMLLVSIYAAGCASPGGGTAGEPGDPIRFDWSGSQDIALEIHPLGVGDGESLFGWVMIASDKIQQSYAWETPTAGSSFSATLNRPDDYVGEATIIVSTARTPDGASARAAIDITSGTVQPGDGSTPATNIVAHVQSGTTEGYLIYPSESGPATIRIFGTSGDEVHEVSLHRGLLFFLDTQLPAERVEIEMADTNQVFSAN